MFEPANFKAVGRWIYTYRLVKRQLGPPLVALIMSQFAGSNRILMSRNQTLLP